MALLLLMALRGNVFIYQGEELGLPQADVPFDRLGSRGHRQLAPDPGPRRRPHADAVDGGRVARGLLHRRALAAGRPAHPPLAVDVQEADPGSTLHVARRLIALRRHHQVLRTGKVHFTETNTPLLIFERGEGSEALLFAFNLGHEAVAWTLPEGWVVAESVNLGGEGVMPPCAGLMAKRA
jgi:alpha-glucosidase